MRRLTMMILAVLVVLSSFSIVGAETKGTFSDVKDTHWAKAQIDLAVERGYVSGYPDNTFQPNKEVTRAEFIKMVVDALKLPHSQGGSPWYQPYVAAAMEMDIHMTGDFDANYNRNMSRKEMSLLAVRAARGYNKDFDIKRSIYEAAKDGIIHGTAPGVISPEGLTTRAQAVVVIERILQVMEGKTLTSDKYAIAAAELYWHKTNIYSVMPTYFDDPINEITTRSGMKFWDEKNLLISNSEVSIQVNEVIAINLGDPKDPNRKLLPALDKMQFSHRGLEASMPSDAYILLFKYHINYLKNPKIYVNALTVDINGFKRPQDTPTTLVNPSTFISLDKNYQHLNEYRANKDGIGIAVKVIPGSNYSFSSQVPSIDISIIAPKVAESSYDPSLTTKIISSRLTKH